jgi:tetratricopeptide (TPR) repeat protein
MLNEKQHAKMKQFIGKHLLNSEKYVQLGPSVALLELKSIIDDEVYETLKQESSNKWNMMNAVNHFRAIFNHECPQDANLEEIGLPVDGINGLSQLNNDTASGVTKSDVVRFITDSIENEILVQQRILKRNTTKVSDNTKQQVKPATPTDKAVTPHFSEKVEGYWKDMLELVDAEDKLYLVAAEMLNKWFSEDNMPLMKKIESELENYLVQCSVQAPSDVETMLIIKFCLILVREPSNTRTDMQDQCLEELENGAPLINRIRHKNLQVVLYCIRGLSETDYEQALHALNRALALDSTYAMALACRGNLYYTNQLYDEALNDFTAAVEIYPPSAVKNRGDLLCIYGKYDEALNDYFTFLQYEPLNTETYINIGQIHQKCCNYEEAVMAYSSALEVDPKASNAKLSRAECLFVLGKEKEALSELDSLRTDNANFSYLVKAQMFQVMNKPKEALDNAKKAKALSKEDASQWSEVILEWARRELHKPIQHHEQVASIIDQNSVPVYGFTTIYGKLIGKTLNLLSKKPEYPEFLSDASNETKMYWEKFFEPLLEATDLHVATVQVNEQQDLYYKSYLYLRVELEITNMLKQENLDEESKNYLFLAKCFIPENEIDIDGLESTANWFEANFNNNPYNRRLKNAYTLSVFLGAWILVKKGSRETAEFALHIFSRCIELAPTLVKAYIGKALCLHQMGQSEEAINVISTGISIDYQYEDAHYFNGFILFDMNDFENAYISLYNALRWENTKVKVKSPLYAQAAELIERVDNHMN